MLPACGREDEEEDAQDDDDDEGEDEHVHDELRDDDVAVSLLIMWPANGTSDETLILLVWHF